MAIARPSVCQTERTVYSILVASSASTVACIAWGHFQLPGGWGLAFVVGLLVFMVTWVLLVRRFGKRVTPVMERVTRQAQAGNIALAMSEMEALLPMGKWVPMLAGQLHAQIGILALQNKQKEKAAQHLDKSSLGAGDAQLFRAAMMYRDGDKGGALALLEKAARRNRKHALLHCTRAWLLWRQGRVDEAIAALNKFLAKEKDQPIAKDNRLRLQNGKRMNLKDFGMNWYALGLERPPNSMMQAQHAGHPGFRQQRRKR